MSQPQVIITGANGGIGKALVQVFRKAGYGVIATSISPAQNELGYDHFIQANLARTVADEPYAEDIFAQIRKALSGRPLKGLINNAAVQILAPVEKLDRSTWRNTLDVNLLAPFFWIREFLPELEDAEGSVVNISSIHARLTKREFVAYATSKAALSGMTRAMAVELGKRVRINAIEPAAIDTEMLRAGFGGNEQGLAQLVSFHPTGRIGGAEEVGELALMLVGAGFPFLNGTVIGLDGGIGGCLSDPGGIK